MFFYCEALDFSLSSLNLIGIKYYFEIPFFFIIIAYVDRDFITT